MLERYSEDDPPPPWMLLEAARIARARDQHAGARQWIARARARLGEPGPRPTVWDVVLTAMDAEILAAQGYARGLDELERLVVTVGSDLRVDLDLGRAEARLSLGRAAEAEAILHAVLADPELTEWDRMSAELLMARVLVAQARWSDAREHLRGLVEGNRLVPVERAQALDALATAELGLGLRDRSLEHAEQAVRALRGADPDSDAMRRAEATLARARDLAPSPPLAGP